MSQVMKDYAMIKLFGKTISLPPDKVLAPDKTVPDQRQSSSAASNSQDSKDDLGEAILEDYFTDPTGETLTEVATSSEASDEEPSTPSVEKNSSQEKTLQKPDKILPCPRCTSMDTKFCYFNNYNVSQPRHFCKNCQRYWTAGGAMRNVPVGSGRRKTNNASVTNYGHIVVSNAMRRNGILVFGSDRPVSESMTSALNFTERPQNCCSKESCEHSSKSFCTAHAFGPSGFPVAFYPSTPQRTCAIPNRPWASIMSSSGPPGLIMSPTSTLGKHSREGNMLIGASNLVKEYNSVRKTHVLVPKTLRMDDPNKAAKSSIWSAAVGIKNEKIGSINGTSLFKAFESKGARNISDIDNTQMVLQANPAALSRSLNFHESA